MPIWLVTLELKRRGLVHRAPNYALIEVSDENLEAFFQSISTLGKDFDSVVVFWKATVESPKLGKKFVIAAQTDRLSSRWSLLDRCADGFVFPLAAGASKDKLQQERLKSQLFQYGGHCIATFANLSNHFIPGSPLADGFKGPVLVASANPNEIVFDERFLNLKSKNLRTESEVEDLARVAKLNSTPILAIAADVQKADGEHSAKLPSSKQNRADLIEVLVRNASLAKVVNVRIARLWNSVWSDLGYSTANKVHPDQVRALAVHRTGRRPQPDALARAGTALRILGGGR